MQNLTIKNMGVSIMKKITAFFTILLMFSAVNLGHAKPPEPTEIKPHPEVGYVTTEDIIGDIIFPAIDKRVIKEYGGDGLFGWQSQKIEGIVYNNNHSYDISIRIQVPDERSKPDNYAEDLVKVRVSPSCDSPKIGCSHGFKVEVLEYEHK
jgi:hypothetical protein